MTDSQKNPSRYRAAIIHVLTSLCQPRHQTELDYLNHIHTQRCALIADKTSHPEDPGICSIERHIDLFIERSQIPSSKEW